MSTFDIPGYSIIRPIDNGGMATVYLAEQKSLEREVAIKVMAPHLSKDPNFVERFEQEARIASHLSHPNIVTIFDYGSITSNANGSTLYLVMAFVDGQDLKTLQPKLSLVTRLKVIQDIANALHYAHEQGVVHRDIKPQNILVEKKNSRALLTDFGVAKARQTSSQLTQTGMTLGTPHYMSPEQALGKKIDHRADIYSLGVVLFFLLTGRVPYDGDSEVAIGLRHHTDPLPKLPESFACFQSVIDRAMAKNPDDRFQAADEFAEAVGKVSIGNLATLVQSLNDNSEAKTEVMMQTLKPAEEAIQTKSSWLLGAGVVGVIAAVVIGSIMLLHRERGEPKPTDTTVQPSLLASDKPGPKTETEAETETSSTAVNRFEDPNLTKPAAELPLTQENPAPPEVEPIVESTYSGRELSCNYRLVKDWGSGWEAEIILQNAAPSGIRDWQVTFALPSGTQITNSYVTRVNQAGNRITFTPHDWNRNLQPGSELKLGFQGTGRAASALNTLTCSR